MPPGAGGVTTHLLFAVFLRRGTRWASGLQAERVSAKPHACGAARLFCSAAAHLAGVPDEPPQRLFGRARRRRAPAGARVSRNTCGRTGLRGAPAALGAVGALQAAQAARPAVSRPGGQLRQLRQQQLFVAVGKGAGDVVCAGWERCVVQQQLQRPRLCHGAPTAAWPRRVPGATRVPSDAVRSVERKKRAGAATKVDGPWTLGVGQHRALYHWRAGAR
jgi:hypothetical protein